jgi:hypothetical protein
MTDKDGTTVDINNGYKALKIMHNNHNILINAPELIFFGTSIKQSLYGYGNKCPGGILLPVSNKTDIVAISFFEITQCIKYKQSCFIYINFFLKGDMTPAVIITTPFLASPVRSIIIDNNDDIIFHRDNKIFSTAASNRVEREIFNVQREKSHFLLRYYLQGLGRKELLAELGK